MNEGRETVMEEGVNKDDTPCTTEADLNAEADREEHTKF